MNVCCRQSISILLMRESYAEIKVDVPDIREWNVAQKYIV